MAAKVTAHPQTRLIELTEAPVDGAVVIDVVTDIYSPLKDDWLVDTTLQTLRFPFRSFGDPIGTSQIGPYVFLNNIAGWRMQPFDADHEVLIVGNLIPESTVQGITLPLWVKRPGRTIFIPVERSAQVLTVETETAALTPTETTRLLEIYKRLSLDNTDKFIANPDEMRTASGDIIIKITGDGKTTSTGERQ